MGLAIDAGRILAQSATANGRLGDNERATFQANSVHLR